MESYQDVCLEVFAIQRKERLEAELTIVKKRIEVIEGRIEDSKVDDDESNPNAFFKRISMIKDLKMLKRWGKELKLKLETP